MRFWLLIVLLSLLGDGVCQEDIGGSNSGNEAIELLVSEQYECENWEWES